MVGRRTGLLIVAVGLVVGACSDSGSGTTPASQPEPAASVAETTVPTTAPPTSATSTTATIALPDTGRVPNDLAELNAMLAAIATRPPGGEVEDAASLLYRTLADSGRIPFVESGNAVFFYYGEGSRIEVWGDFTSWDRGQPIAFDEVGDTWLWRASTTIPNDARSEYKLLVDGHWILDPGNERTQMGGLGSNSEFTMPAFSVTDFSDPADGPSGTVDAGVISSAAMGYDIAYQVYLPPAYAGLESLPVLYATDGTDFSNPEMGAMTVILDNLIGSGTVEPVMAVFMDAWDPEHTVNRRETEFLARPEDYAAFLTDELVPLVDAEYATDPRPESRVIVGTSLGAVGAVYFSLLPPETFGNLALYSPAFWAMDPRNHADPMRVEAAMRMNELLAAGSQCLGDDCSTEGARIFMSAGIPEWDVGDVSPVYAAWEEAGFDYMVLSISDGHNWGHWAGVTDEMLEFFFGTG